MTRIEYNGALQPPEQRLVWSVDPERKLLYIRPDRAITDEELLKEVPRIWQECPEVVWYNTVVDHRKGADSGNWTWGALQKLGVEWSRFEAGRNPGKRVAIVTDNYWLIQLVNKAFAFIFPGSRFRCFSEIEDATEWAEHTPAEDAE